MWLNTAGNWFFRQREDDGDGLHLGDDDQARGAGCTDDIAHVNLAKADDAGDGRGDVGVVHVDLRLLNGGAVGSKRSNGLAGSGFLRLGRFLRDDSRGVQLVVTLRLHLGERGIGLISRQIALRDGKRRKVGLRVDLNERLALANALALLEVDLRMICPSTRLFRVTVL